MTLVDEWFYAGRFIRSLWSLKARRKRISGCKPMAWFCCPNKEKCNFQAFGRGTCKELCRACIPESPN